MIRILLSLVMLFSLSCSEVESLDVTADMSPDSPLKINALTPLSTKGELVLEPKDMGSIGLYCALTGEYQWADTTTFSKLKDQRFYVTDDGEWLIDGNSEPWGYQSESDYYTFFAYSPYNEDTQGVTPRIVNGELLLDYIVPSNSIDQPDLMYAEPRKDIYADTENGVSLNFYHTLASVSFRVISLSDETITGIDLSGVVSDGTLSWDYESEQPEWSPGKVSGTSFSVEVGEYTPVEDSSAQVNTDRGYLMMIPQVLESDVEVTIAIEDADPRTLTIPAGTEWLAGYKYSYFIRFDGGNCDFIFGPDEISNCYIINPTPGEDTIVQIPIEERINDFWKNYDGSSKKIRSGTIGADLKAVLVWEDFEGKTFSFTYNIDDDDEGNMAAELVIPAQYQEGNFVFAIDEVDSDDRLWSWHLWFTDYNPDIIADANRYKIQPGVDMDYELGGYSGAVHRYADSGDVTVWSDIYSDKFIMDRNIGERNEFASDYGAGSVYYQFGRKDPFPGKGGLYDDGDTQPGSRLNSGFSFASSVVLNDDVFVSGTSASTNWCNDDGARDTTVLWNDKNLLVKGYTEGKSIFDPSPLGWRLPVKDTWSSFNGTGSTQAGDSDFKSVGKYNYYGYRIPTAYLDEALAKTDTLCCVWSANLNIPDTTLGECFFTSDDTVLAPHTLTVTYCLPVRAIEE